MFVLRTIQIPQISYVDEICYLARQQMMHMVSVAL
jgi:hypothetical protein